MGKGAGKGKGKKKGKKDKVQVIPGGLTAEEEKDRQSKAKKAFEYFKETKVEEKKFDTYRQEREQLNYFWIVEKKRLEDKKAELRNKERELQDLEEKHAVEVKVYKQRVKHLLYEHQDEVTQEKTKGEEALSQTQTAHRLDEAELKADRRALRLQKQENELAHDAFLNSLKATHDRAVHDLRKEFARKGTEVQKQYEAKTKAVREALEEERKKDCGAIERQKNVHIEQLMASHEKAFAEIKNYYNDITHNNLDLIKSLKEEVADVRRREIQDEKAMETVRSPRFEVLRCLHSVDVTRVHRTMPWVVSFPILMLRAGCPRKQAHGRALQEGQGGRRCSY